MLPDDASIGQRALAKAAAQSRALTLTEPGSSTSTRHFMIHADLPLVQRLRRCQETQTTMAVSI